MDSLLLIERRDDDGDGGPNELFTGASSCPLKFAKVLRGIDVGEFRVQDEAVNRRGCSAGNLG